MLADVNLVRALGLAGIRSVVVAPPDDPARFSRSTAANLPWIDPESDPQALVEQLLAFGRWQPEPPVIFYDGDATLLLVSRYRERLREAFRFVVGDASLIEALVDKAQFQALAERLDLPVPRGRHFRAGETADATDLRFPVVVKPAPSRTPTWDRLTRAKALTAGSAGDLRALLERAADAGVDLLAQEMIPGPESRIESYHAYIDDRGDVAGEFTGQKLRTRPRSYGHSTALVITQAHDVAAIGRAVVRRIALRGVVKCDFKRSHDGRLHLLEINPRFNLWHHPAALAGMNLPALVYRDLAGLPRLAQGVARAEVTWCDPRSDFRAAREDGMGTGRWLAWVLRCDAKHGFAWDDPLPLVRSKFKRSWPLAWAALRRRSPGS